MCISLINSTAANGTRRRRLLLLLMLLLLFCLFRYRFLESFARAHTHNQRGDATDCDRHCEHYEHGHSYSHWPMHSMRKYFE